MTYSYFPLFLFTAIFLSACNQDIGTYSGEAQDIQPNVSNTAPVAPPVVVEINEDATKTISLNGTDADGDTLSYRKVTDPTHGSISINGDTATYTPTANYHGNDSFTYKVNDGTNNSNTATVSITVLAVNDAPTANAGNNQTGLEGESFNLSGSGTDIENDTLTYSWQQTDNSGVFVKIANTQNATILFAAPEVTAATTLSFTVTVADGNGGTTTDTVDIVVNNLTINDPDLRRCFGNPFPSGIALYQLPTVNCNDVDLSTADLSELEKLPNLINLTLSENLLGTNITAIATLNKLTTLALIGNNIKDISTLSEMTNLTSLRLNNNSINDISALSGMNKLTSLVLNDNNISDISVLSNLTALTELNLSDNRINDLSTLLRLSKLTSLSLSSNNTNGATTLSDISLFASLTTLTNLDLSDNSISDIDALTGLTQLTTLNLANNQITEVQIGDDAFIESIFSSMSVLATLNLRNNLLITVNSISPMINELSLDVTNNCIPDFSDFVQATNITIIGNKTDENGKLTNQNPRQVCRPEETTPEPDPIEKINSNNK